MGVRVKSAHSHVKPEKHTEKLHEYTSRLRFGSCVVLDFRNICVPQSLSFRQMDYLYFSNTSKLSLFVDESLAAHYCVTFLTVAASRRSSALTCAYFLKCSDKYDAELLTAFHVQGSLTLTEKAPMAGNYGAISFLQRVFMPFMPLRQRVPMPHRH